MPPPKLGDDMKRRTFFGVLGGAVAGWPLATRAQQQKIWRVRCLISGPPESLDSFRQRMTDLGYIEGKNLIVDARAAEGRYDRLPGFAQEIVDLHPDAIVAEATPAIAAAQRATKTIPIVMAPVTDPIGSGFIESFARPGRNITGVANMFGDLTAKSLEILHRVLPDAKTVAVLMSANPTHARLYDVASNGARMVGMSTLPFVAATPADLDRAFSEIKQARCDAVYTLADPYRPKIPELAAATQIPAIYQYGYFVEFGGGLMSYGPDTLALVAHAADYLDKIFKGANPAVLPVEQPTKFEFVLNLRAAKALGLALPASIVLLADKVVE
jgi:putative tryptophan/tyrosine transport system substrate-binding protein